MSFFDTETFEAPGPVVWYNSTLHLNLPDCFLMIRFGVNVS